MNAITTELVDALVEALRIGGIDAEDKCEVDRDGELCCSLCRAVGCIAWKVERAKKS